MVAGFAIVALMMMDIYRVKNKRNEKEIRRKCNEAKWQKKD